jgi:hypothetical protein
MFALDQFVFQSRNAVIATPSDADYHKGAAAAYGLVLHQMTGVNFYTAEYPRFVAAVQSLINTMP